MKLIWATLALALFSVGCGGGNGTPEFKARRTSESPQSRVAVIRAWADTLRRGDVNKATSYFNVPAIVANGTPPILLDTHREVKAFNRTLPCGARLLRTFVFDRYVTAEFRLTERPGKGRCGEGTGQRARVTIVVLEGKIVEWRRVSTRPQSSGPVV